VAEELAVLVGGLRVGLRFGRGRRFGRFLELLLRELTKIEIPIINARSTPAMGIIGNLLLLVVAGVKDDVGVGVGVGDAGSVAEGVGVAESVVAGVGFSVAVVFGSGIALV